MILTGQEILRNVEEKKVIIDPFSKSQLNPNSYNFTLGNKLLVYKDFLLDAKKACEVIEITIPESGYTLSNNVLYLGHTKEIIGSDYFVPIIRGRSSIGRLGLFVNITSDLIDIGSIGQITLQLTAVQPVIVYPGMQIGQVTFWKPLGSVSKYQGRYQQCIGPVASKMYMDFINGK